jgi:hypothetical protein
MERSEKIGLGIATAGHVLLFGVLSAGFLSTPNPLKLNSPPMDVSMVDEVALKSMAPAVSTTPPPAAESPEQGPPEEAAPAPEPQPPPRAEPEAAPPPPPRPAPPRAVAEKAKPSPKPPAAPPKAETKPAPPRAKPAARPAPARETPQVKPAAEKPKASGSGTGARQRTSLLGPDFLKGIQSETRTPRPAKPSPAPAAAMGPQQKTALDAEIRRQLKAHWRPPSGADADQLVTLLSVHLDKMGRVVGTPEVIDQQGVTASNRPQAKLHAERAVQAVMLASPFQNLPPEYYDQWKWLQPLRFDARLTR